MLANYIVVGCLLFSFLKSIFETSYKLFYLLKERDDTILTLQSKIHQLEAEHTFFKNAQSPEDRSRRLELVTDDLKQTKETLALQNEDIERMQKLLQHKDDEIDKLREVVDEDETNGSVSIFHPFPMSFSINCRGYSLFQIETTWIFTKSF